MKGIEVRNVRKSFHGNAVLKDVSLSCRPGTITGIVGRNGSGKSVLFKVICGLVIPESGEVFVDGKQIGRDIDFPETVGALIEQPGFMFTESGFRNLKELAVIRHKIDDDTIRRTLTKVGLDGATGKWVGRYSLGMKQRLGIAQAIMEEPSTLIMDEPMNGLDYEGIELVRQLLQELKAQGRCILLASHNKEDIELLCDEVYELSGGCLFKKTAEE